MFRNFKNDFSSADKLKSRLCTVPFFRRLFHFYFVQVQCISGICSDYNDNVDCPTTRYELRVNRSSSALIDWLVKRLISTGSIGTWWCCCYSSQISLFFRWPSPSSTTTSVFTGSSSMASQTRSSILSLSLSDLTLTLVTLTFDLWFVYLKVSFSSTT